jgi:hypothetical protein
MSTEPNPHIAPNLESRVLRALCNAPHDASTRAAVLAKLRAHQWQDPEHRVVFEALTLCPGRHSAQLREQLPAQATRMGFPEVNWDHYFATSDQFAAIETLVSELLGASREEKP